MLIFLFIFYLSRYLPASASPSLPDTTKLNDDPLPTLTSSPCTCPDLRSIWDILWSCLATIFACSWVSVHPNIPGPDESRTRIAIRRLELMFWAIVAPEMIITWALRQWFGARKLANEWRANGWTKTHGYFIQMGGFVLVDGETTQGVLSPERLRELYSEGRIKFPTITEKEIEDRSKGDALSKTLALGQTAWFLVQCLARVAQGLDITQLELLTVALAVLNGFMYFLWWNKPLDVQSSAPVYLLETQDTESTKEQEDGDPVMTAVQLDPASEPPDNELARASRHSVTAQISTATRRIRRLWTSFCNAPRALIFLFSSVLAWIRNVFHEKGFLRVISSALIHMIHGPKRLVLLVVSRLAQMTGSDTEYTPPGQKKVPTFSSLKPTYEEDGRGFYTLCTIGMIFGGIHCAGWHLVFPSIAEAWLWRISSVFMLAIPLLPFSAALLSESAKQIWGRHRVAAAKWVPVFGNILISILALALPVYIVARLALLVEAFIGLRRISPLGLLNVNWTSFIPHV